jgi:hypothetical protein
MMAFYISLLGSILTGIIAYNSIKLNYQTIRREFPSTSCMKSFFEAVKYEEVSLPTFVTFVVLTIFFYNK